MMPQQAAADDVEEEEKQKQTQKQTDNRQMSKAEQIRSSPPSFPLLAFFWFFSCGNFPERVNILFSLEELTRTPRCCRSELFGNCLCLVFSFADFVRSTVIFIPRVIREGNRSGNRSLSLVLVLVLVVAVERHCFDDQSNKDLMVALFRHTTFRGEW